MVVACVDQADSLDRCLASLQATCAGIKTEVIVVSAAEGPHARDISSRYSSVRFLGMPPDSLVPRLWSEGISASLGPIVALTISECSANSGWVPAMINAIADGAAAAGGPISLTPNASIFEAAVFFLRYSAFLSDVPSSTQQIAGDNCAYSRESLESGGWSRDSGFWEYDVNKILREAGKTISWVPLAIMQFGDAGSVMSTARRRFTHGRLFGASRTERGESSLGIAVASPFVPFVLFARATNRVWPHRQYRSKLIRSLPAFAMLSAAWALGEAVGAIGGSGADRG